MGVTDDAMTDESPRGPALEKRLKEKPSLRFSTKHNTRVSAGRLSCRCGWCELSSESCGQGSMGCDDRCWPLFVQGVAMGVVHVMTGPDHLTGNKICTRTPSFGKMFLRVLVIVSCSIVRPSKTSHLCLVVDPQPLPRWLAVAHGGRSGWGCAGVRVTV